MEDIRVTKISSSLKNKPYHKRLEMLNLATLKFRRLRGGMIEKPNITCAI